MPLRYLIDENLRGSMWDIIQRHNARGLNPIDALRVGDEPAPPLGVRDDAILFWCELEERILVTYDKKSMPAFFQSHLDTGGHCPGIFILRDNAALPEILDFLVVAAHASEPAEWQDQIKHIP